MYYVMDESSVREYVRESLPIMPLFEGTADICVADLSEGNINLIFRVFSASDPIAKSVLIKQALPYARRYPELRLPLDRARIEYEALHLERECCPDHVPLVYRYDPEMCLNMMEDMNRHVVMRSGLMQQIRYPLAARHLGRFLARTLFYTSDLYLPSTEKKALVAKFINPALCRITEDLVFTEPYVDHPNNHWNPQLDSEVAEIRNSEELCSEVLVLKRKFMCDAQALIHGDLHTGSILVNEDETKFIDPEFAYVGPMSFDVGNVVAHLVLSFASQEWHAGEKRECDDYRQWLLTAIREMWKVMEAELSRLWETEGRDERGSAAFRDKYMRELLIDAAGFAGCEIVRRIVGLAHVLELDSIADLSARASAESRSLRVAETWLVERNSFTSIDDVISAVEQPA
jgi:5-methylthioribose kinase